MNNTHRTRDQINKILSYTEVCEIAMLFDSAHNEDSYVYYSEYMLICTPESSGSSAAEHLKESLGQKMP